MLSIDIILNAAARHIIKIVIIVVVLGFLLNYFKKPLLKLFSFISIPKQYVAMFNFVRKYKVDILLVMLLLLVTLAYTRDMSFEKDKPSEEVELIVETLNV